MNTLTVFSEKERQYDRYQARQEYLRIESTNTSALERAIKGEQKALALAESEAQRAESERREKEAEVLEIQKLKALLQLEKNQTN